MFMSAVDELAAKLKHSYEKPTIDAHNGELNSGEDREGELAPSANL
jgi:hypothetical protein